jgi:phosphoribosylamine-glycine ligase
MPVMLDGGFTLEDRMHLHYGELGFGSAGLVTSGLYGWSMVVTGAGSSVAEAQMAAYDRVRRVTIPNARYRLDIGNLLIAGQLEALEVLGMLD